MGLQAQVKRYATRRMKSQLLIEFGRLNPHDQVLVVAASNIPWDIDPAFLLRFDLKFLVDLPNPLEVELILRHYLKGADRNVQEGYYTELTKKMIGMSGRRIKKGLHHASTLRFKELVVSKHFREVISEPRICYTLPEQAKSKGRKDSAMRPYGDLVPRIIPNRNHGLLETSATTGQ